MSKEKITMSIVEINPMAPPTEDLLDLLATYDGMKEVMARVEKHLKEQVREYGRSRGMYAYSVDMLRGEIRANSVRSN